MSQTIQSRHYTVRGMTCGHCVLSVREEVSELPGVHSVDVDLATGRMTVSGEDISDDAVRAAVADAGYEVAPVSMTYLAWAAAVGAAGCGRCVSAA